MPSLEEFRKLLATNADEAFKQYSLQIDGDNLDYTDDKQAHGEFKRVKVGFVYKNKSGRDEIIMTPDPNGKECAYLPWKNASEGGISKVTLDGDGPEYFSTSQLDGCRFSIQYHDTDRKVVTVQHLAGDVKGLSGKEGSLTRDGLQEEGNKGLPQTATPVLQRSLSIGSGIGKMGKAGKTFKDLRPNTTYYDGGVAAVFGYRTKTGAWTFYGAESNAKGGLGLTNLDTKTKVTGPLTGKSQTK